MRQIVSVRAAPMPPCSGDRRFGRPTRHAAAWVTALAATFIIAGCGHKAAETPPTSTTSMSVDDYAQSISNQASSACSRVANAGPPATQGTVSGPSVEMHSISGGPYIPDSKSGVLHATSDAEFKSLVCVEEQQVKVGTYEDQNSHETRDAIRDDWSLRVLSWPDGVLIAERSFQGADPPEECSPSAGNCYGDPQADATVWLKTVITG